ncbi:hypothetical protein CCB80_01815 [Armatimonadetes bacterium Uphvl-Ar1]|nr:hypothetical protein CCB80_01815 [Armatimonadetes bacterium Uphvl-Ar1]
MEFLSNLTWLIAAGEAHGKGEGGKQAAHALEMSGLMFYVGLVALIIFGAAAVAKSGLNSKFFTKPLTKLFEQLYVFIQGLAIGTIGPHGRKYMSILFSLWLVVFVSNVIALFFPTSPTADLSFNLALAFIAVGYVQWEGIRANGVWGHFSHFAGPKLPIYLLPITLMIFIIEIISEVMKNVSLSLRLYGNIEGGHRAADAMNVLGQDLLIPFGAFLLPIKLLTCVVQALIFCLLFAVYLSLVTHHDHEEGHDHESHGEAAPAH